MNTEQQNVLAWNLAAQYRQIGDRLLDYKNHRFPVGVEVYVKDPKFNGLGVVTKEDGCPPDKLAVILESGNTWWYPIENCTFMPKTTTQPT